MRWLRRCDAWGERRRLASVAVFVALLAGLAAAWPTAGPWVRSAALFSDVVVQLPVRPLTWVTRVPSTEWIEWDAGGRGLLTRPAARGPAPALLLVLGADPAPPDDPRVERLTDVLARLGFAVLLPVSDELDAKQVTPIEVERLVAAFLVLERAPAVRADRIGIVGLSVGGSLAIVAATDGRIAARVQFVLAIGPYYDAGSLVASSAARAYRTPDGDVHEWDRSRTTENVVRETLLATLSEADRATFEAAGPSPALGWLRDLLGDPDLEQAEAIVAGLGLEQRTMMEAVSPRHHLEGLRAPLYLLHDRNDEFVPWTESEAIAVAYEPAIFHRIELLEHVEPQIGNLPVLGRDGWRLLRLFARIFREAG